MNKQWKKSWPQHQRIKFYGWSKFEKVVKVCVPTCPIFTGPVTNIAMALYSNSERYNAMDSSVNVLASHILVWMYRKKGLWQSYNSWWGSGAIPNGVSMLESASKSESTFKNNGRVVTMWLVGNNNHFLCNKGIIVLVTLGFASSNFDCYSYNHSLIALNCVWFLF